MGKLGKEKKGIISLFFRYMLVILVALPNLYLFYLVFTPLTVYFVFYTLSTLAKVSLFENIIVFSNFSIEIIPACVAGAAYYLLFALNLSIPKINIRKRMSMIGFSFALLFAFNVLRILLLTGVIALASANSLALFDILHKSFWYGMNVLVVVLIWFAEARVFDIKKIPVYDDLKFLYSKSLFTK